MCMAVGRYRWKATVDVVVGVDGFLRPAFTPPANLNARLLMTSLVFISNWCPNRSEDHQRELVIEFRDDLVGI